MRVEGLEEPVPVEIPVEEPVPVESPPVEGPVPAVPVGNPVGEPAVPVGNPLQEPAVPGESPHGDREPVSEPTTPLVWWTPWSRFPPIAVESGSSSSSTPHSVI